MEICPDIFELKSERDIAYLKMGVDLSLAEKIMEAAEAYPVAVIHYEK